MSHREKYAALIQELNWAGKKAAADALKGKPIEDCTGEEVAEAYWIGEAAHRNHLKDLRERIFA